MYVINNSLVLYCAPG